MVRAARRTVSGPAERLDVARDILQRFGPSYLRRHPELTAHQAKVLRRMIDCRTAAMGGHLLACDECGASWPHYNACRDRHCPTCQSANAVRWLVDHLNRLISTPHFHVVATMPSELRRLCLSNQRVVYDMLFASLSEALLELSRNHWGAVPGITAVLHTWSRQMTYHPHVHCVVTGGGLSLDGARWVPGPDHFLFPVKVISALLRGKFMARLVRAYDNGELQFAGSCAEYEDPEAFAVLRDRLYRAAWVVHAKKPFGGAEQVIRYLSRYTHRVAISSSRLVSVDDDAIVFRTRDHKVCRVRPDEFIRRLLLHVLPKNFRKIRYYGLMAPSNVRERLPLAQRLAETMSAESAAVSAAVQEPLPYETAAEATPRPLVGERCPCCEVGTVMRHALDVARAPRGPP